MTCTNCERELTGDLFVREGELPNGIPMVSIEATPDRDWIICDSCNTLLCNDCCGYPQSGYCDTCIKKYNLKGYLEQVGLIRRKEDHC